MAAGVNNLNPFIIFCIDTQNKYGRRAHLLKLNLNTSYFQDGRESAIFKIFKTNFLIMR